MSTVNLPHDHGHNNISEFIEKLPQSNDFLLASNTFNQLSDVNRLKLFWILCYYEECVINLSAIMDMSSPAVSHHLKLLKSAGLIVSRRSGKEVYYKAAPTAMVEMLRNTIASILSLSCPDIESKVDKRTDSFNSEQTSN